MVTLHHNAFPWTETPLHHSIISAFRTKLDKTLLRYTIRTKNPDVCRTFFDNNGLCRDHHRILDDIQQHGHIGELPRKQFPVRVRHLSPDEESPRLGIYLRVSKIHKPLIFIHGFIGQSNGHIRIEFPRRISLPDIHIRSLAPLIIKVSHLELHQHRIALDHSGQKRLRARPHKSSYIHETLAYISADRRSYHGVTQRDGILQQVSLAHSDICNGTLVRSYRIIHIQLAGSFLLIQRAYPVQVPFRFLGKRLVLLEKRLRLGNLGRILSGVYHEKHLVLFDI